MAETEGERLDRELGELLEEIRVILPGVQLLGALLFTVAFSSAFGRFTSLERAIYFAGFFSSGVAAVLLVAPSAQARILFRQRKKDTLVRLGSRLAFAGTLALAVAMWLSTYLVGEFVYGNGIAAAATAVLVAATTWIWYGLPMLERMSPKRH
jgi:hypothetical protein